MNETLKHLVLFCSAITLGAAMARGQQAAVPRSAATSTTNAAGPKIQFEAMVYDFGRMKAGDPVKYTFVFTNTGDATLILTNVRPQHSSRTTVGEWSRQVEPGKTGSIPILIKTTGHSGPLLDPIIVACNDESQQTVVLKLTGESWMALEVIPALAVLFLTPDGEGERPLAGGGVERVSGAITIQNNEIVAVNGKRDVIMGSGATASVTVTITNNTDDAVALWEAASNNKAFTAELRTNTPGRSYQLVISAIAPLEAPGEQAQISMKTSWTNQPTLTVPMYTKVRPRSR
jgi:hypothetical protein